MQYAQAIQKDAGYWNVQNAIIVCNMVKELMMLHVDNAEENSQHRLQPRQNIAIIHLNTHVNNADNHSLRRVMERNTNGARILVPLIPMKSARNMSKPALNDSVTQTT